MPVRKADAAAFHAHDRSVGRTLGLRPLLHHHGFSDFFHHHRFHGLCTSLEFELSNRQTAAASMHWSKNRIMSRVASRASGSCAMMLKPCDIASNTCSSALIPARCTARCSSTVEESKKSRVPARKYDGQKPFV